MRTIAAALAVTLAAAGCEKAQLLAPTNSTITVSAAATVLPSNGSTQITAVVIEQPGTPVQNGTTVRFTSSLGRVEPAEVQTRNGIAITTFHADGASGVAQIRAFSGGATGGSGSADSPTTNVVEITVGAAAVKGVSLRANPANIPAAGGTVELIATVVSTDGAALPGVLVTFNANRGTLESSTAVTDAGGEARTKLTTVQTTTVNATAGLVTSSDVTVTANMAPGLKLSVSPNPVVGQAVTLTIAPDIPTGGASPRVVVAWGDGSEQDLGVVSSATTVAHTYVSPGSYTITATGTADGDTVVASTGVTVAPVGITLTVSPDTGKEGTRFEFTASSGDAVAASYEWTLKRDGEDEGQVRTSGNKLTRVLEKAGVWKVKVTVTTVGGQTASAVVQVNVTK